MSDRPNPPETATDVQPRGLYDGFAGYRMPTAEQWRRVYTAGLVALDANVLLNVYRYADQARDDLLLVLDRLGDRLWVPHQAVVEFWRTRERVLLDPRETATIVKNLREVRNNAAGQLRSWGRAVSLPDERCAEIVDELSAAVERAVGRVEAFKRPTGLGAVDDTSSDALLARIEQLLMGRVGPPLDDEAYAAALEEGRRRVEAQQPPGYKDAAKGDKRSPGDYLVWCQLLLEAARRGSRDVLLVTSDVKEDWWRLEDGEPRGPRNELAEELLGRTGAALMMQTPAMLLSTARTALDLPVHEASVDAAERLDHGLLWRLLAVSTDDPPLDVYWRDYLSDNGRRLYRAAANIELYRGPGFTFDDIAEALSVTYESARSFHRTSGRSAKRWRDDTGTEEPIRLDWDEYRSDDERGGMRTVYHLPPGVAESVQRLATS